jgi:ATP-dependent helicase/nuclease subunit A
MSRPVDHEIRQAAETELERSFAVRAGAGSGKTAVLTKRVLNLLEQGVAPGRIAAITFTEKAAGELQRRVRDALEEARRDQPSEVLDRALTDFHELTLSTVHSFCRTLLGDEPLASRWAPGTQVGNQDIPGMQRALGEWRKAARAADERAARVLDGVSDYHARKALGHLITHRELEPARPTGAVDWAALATALSEHHRAIEELAAKCNSPKCKALAKSEPLRALLAATSTEGADGVVAFMNDDGGVPKLGNSGRKGDWPDGALDEYRAAVAEVGTLAGRCSGEIHAFAMTVMKQVALPIVLEAARAEAEASFDDLLFRAAALLRDDGTRARLAERFDALLIDEVQDTDPMQAEIAALLARPPEATGDWTAAGPRPGGLFAVGDPKQSIYRFRRADVTVWDDLQEVVKATSPEGSVELAQNFRSVPGLVGWFNHTFADLPGYADQVAWREPGALDPVVLIESEVPAKGSEDSPDCLHAVAYLRAQIESGAEVVDRETGKRRPMRWSDVMVLVPTWSRAHELAGALLRLGTEAVVGGGYTFFKSDEVRLSLSALRALDEPADSEAVVHLMRGLFGFTLDELADHIAKGGSWRYTIEDQPKNDVSRALELLRALRRDHHESGSWVPRLDRLLDESRALHVWSLLVDGPARLANLDKLRAIIRELEAETRSPAQVLTRLSELQKKSDEAELDRVDEADDAVLITTVFKAKGLEAPVVLLWGMTRKNPSIEVIPDRQTGRVHFKLGDLEPAGWQELREAEKDEFLAERARWMYVAATRARDQLVILRHPKTNLLDYLSAGLPQPGTEDEPLPESVELTGGIAIRVVHGAELPEPPLQTETFKGADETIDALLHDPPGKGDPGGEARQRELRERGKKAKRACARWTSVGEVATGHRGYGGPEDGQGGVGRAGGTVVHRALELLDLKQSREDLKAQAPELIASLAADAGLSEELTEACVKVIERILDHEVMDRVRAASEHWKETPFAMQDRGRVVSGVIDLCFPVDEAKTKWVVVDWKSDTPAEGTKTRQQYEKQLKKYAKALVQTVAPCEEVEALLAGPHPELPNDPAEDALKLVDPEFAPHLRRLIDAGAPVPVIGYEVLDGEAQLECAWVDAKVGLALDVQDAVVAAMEKDGWRLVRVESWETRWERRAAEALRERLNLSATENDSDTAGDDSDLVNEMREGSHG